MLLGKITRTACIGILVLAGAAALILPPVVTGQSAMPELPRRYMDTTYVAPTRRTLSVPAGEDFQAALDRAQPGDVITLEAGATFRGPFTLPNKLESGWIIIRTSAPDNILPPQGTRVNPSYANVMPKLVATSGSVITAAPGAHHYRFVGIEIRPQEGVFLYNLILLGLNERMEIDLPHHIIFDRCYLHGDPAKGTRRGIALNSRDTALIDSYLSDFKEVGADSQAIAGWNGPGPFKIANNYLEGAGENVMFGGADPRIANLVPSDIEIRRNHFFKPLSWRIGESSYAGTPWTIKNLFELTNAQRVIVEGNIFEQNWAHAQVGFAIVLTVRNADGTAPWSVVQDVTFQNNIVRHASSGVIILGHTSNEAQQTKRVLIRNNLFDDISGVRWGGDGRLFQLLTATADVTIDHNTGFQDNPIIMSGSPGAPHTGFIFRNNIAPRNTYGIISSEAGEGLLTLAVSFPGAVVEKNVIAGGRAVNYPPDNFFPSSLDSVGFVDRAGGDYRLASSSQYRNASTDGKDVGVDFTSLFGSVGLFPQPPKNLRVLPPR